MVQDAIEMETRTRSPSNEARTDDDGDEEREGLLDGGLKPTDGQPRLLPLPTRPPWLTDCSTGNATGEDLPVGLERWKIIASFFVFGLINKCVHPQTIPASCPSLRR